MTLSPETLQARAAAFQQYGGIREAARQLNVPYTTMHTSLKRAAEQGLLGTAPVIPGFAIKSIASKRGDAWVKQTKEAGEPFTLPQGHAVKGVSALVDAEGRTIQKWVKTGQNAEEQEAAFAATVEALKEELPRVTMMQPPASVQSELLNQYTVTDSHFGMLAHREETGADYDLKLAEQLLLDWFGRSIWQKPMRCLPLTTINLLWREELHTICGSLGVRRVSKLDMRQATDEIRWRMNGEQITRVICKPLRARECVESDPPIFASANDNQPERKAA